MGKKAAWNLFKVSLIAIALAFFIFLTRQEVWSMEYLSLSAVFAFLLFLLSSRTKLDSRTNTTSSITLPIAIPSLYLFGPLYGSIVVLFGTIDPSQLKKNYSRSTFFANRSLMFISAVASAFWLRFADRISFQWSEIWVLGLMAFTFFITNNFILWLGLRILGEKSNEEFLLFAIECAKNVLLSSLIAIIFIIVYQSHQLPGVLILFILLFLFKDVLQARFKLVNSFFQVIESFARVIDTKDPYTRGHSERVAQYVEDLARRIHLNPTRIPHLVQAAKLHDVGKLGIPEFILHKPGKLTTNEFARVKVHPVLGEELLENIEMMKDYLPIIRHHHEWFDGSGYPDGLRGEEIPLEARILAMADAFDCMTTDRVYRKAFNKEEVILELKKCSGSQFDPNLVKELIDMIRSGHYDYRFSENEEPVAHEEKITL